MQLDMHPYTVEGADAANGRVRTARWLPWTEDSAQRRGILGHRKERAGRPPPSLCCAMLLLWLPALFLLLIEAQDS
jgi:hypothetical protein